MNRQDGLQFDVLFINGQRLRVTAAEVVQILYHRYTISFYLATILVIIALRPHQQTDGLSGTLFVLVYFGIYLASFVNFAIMLVGAGWIMNRLGRATVSTTVVQVSATLINTWLASLAIAQAGGEMISLREMILQWLMNSIIFEMALTGFGLHLVPSLLRDLRGDAQATGDQQVARMMDDRLNPEVQSAPSGGQETRWLPELEMNSGDVLRAEAQQNYVLVITQTQRKLVRLSFQRFIGLMPEAAGIRVHRSHWVAKSQITDFQTQDGRIFVLLRNGSRVPVSKQYQLDLLPED